VFALAVLAFEFWQRDADRALSGAESPLASTPVSQSTVVERPPLESLPPRLVVLPLADLSGEQAFADFAAGLTEELNSALVAFDIVTTVSPNLESSAGIAFGELRETYQAGYTLIGSVRVADGTLRVILRAMDTGLGTQFWTSSFDEAFESNAIDLQQRLALSIAQLLASPFGPVFAHEIERIAALPTAELNAYQCVLRYYDYARSFDPGLHAESVRCMQRTAQIDPQFAPAWSALATLYLHEHSFGFTPQSDRGPPLERALEAARTALDIDGSGRIAALAMAGIQRASGDGVEFRRAAERALALEPRHPAILAQIGYMLILDGDPVRGQRLLDEAIPVTANVPGWYYVGHALGALQAGDYDAALTWALRIDAPTWFAAPLTVAASAALAGRLDLAQREIERLGALYPEFGLSGRLQLENWLGNNALVEILMDGLQRAGLEAV
jgi:TolB-like protein